MSAIEQTLESREVAAMVDKEHRQILKDIRRYIEQFNEGKISPVDFFKESTYVDVKGETRPCYRITKKGCEFIAHKMTGKKGTEFTARYINRFHEMEEEIRSMPAAGRRRVTFLQEIKAAERVMRGMSQKQKLDLYKSIYERHGLCFNIAPEIQIEDRKVSDSEEYREKSINMVAGMGNQDYLFKIYHYILAKYRRDKEYERKE